MYGSSKDEAMETQGKKQNKTISRGDNVESR
jgi:hypothetical protein